MRPPSSPDSGSPAVRFAGPIRTSSLAYSVLSESSADGLLGGQDSTKHEPVTSDFNVPTRYNWWSLSRWLLWLFGVASMVWFGLSILGSREKPAGFGHAAHGEGAYALWGNDSLPADPAPVIVTDRRGRAKWTVSIPPDLDFPLLPEQYRGICSQAWPTSRKILDMKRHQNGTHYYAGHPGYHDIDPNFMDVAEAKKHGILPQAPECSRLSTRTTGRLRFRRDLDAAALRGENGLDARPVCERSLTYVLESSDAGFGNALFGLWTAYGLAQEEGRAFFIDDSYWAYGKYLSYFAPPPEQPCRPPPRNEIVPCPHHARHLLASAATVHWTFGHAFNDAHEDIKAKRVMRQKPIFALAREGYKALFHLNDEDELYVEQRKAELRAEGGSAHPDLVLGVHVRHGDRYPHEFRVKKKYMPLERYVSAIQSLAISVSNFSSPTATDNSTISDLRPTILLASDDPLVYGSDAFENASRTQDRVQLPPFPSSSSEPDPSASPIPSWNGGFTSEAFWSIDSDSGPDTEPDASLPKSIQANQSQPTWRRTTPSAETLKVRERLGRSYLLDLKILGEATDGVVCTVSAVGCRLLAVMMGWERAIEQRLWFNIDRPQDWDWMGIMW